MKKLLALLLAAVMLLGVVSTYEAAKAFCEANGLEFKYYKPASDSDTDRISSIENAIDDGYNVIIMPGYAFGPAIQTVAPENSEVTFIALDVSEGDIGELAGNVPANLYCAVYQEELCGYMAGYAAVKLGYWAAWQFPLLCATVTASYRALMLRLSNSD